MRHSASMVNNLHCCINTYTCTDILFVNNSKGLCILFQWSHPPFNPRAKHLHETYICITISTISQNWEGRSVWIPHSAIQRSAFRTLSREYRVLRNRYSRLLFTSELRLCANLRVQEQSTNMTSSMPATNVCVTSQINCSDVTMPNQ